MDETRKPYALRAMSYVAIAFVMFLAAEGLAHVAGAAGPAVATPANAAADASIDVSGDAGYLPRRFPVIEAAGEPVDAAPTF